tara:strand:- start:290 stop:652 length:363 start_codon:yes stop_codon:yes gene_type:complete
MAYASGKYAYFICDTCSFRYPYKTAKTTWDNFRVCSECYEPKHPQLDPPSITVDAEQLWKPRPDVPLPQAGLGVVSTINPTASVVLLTGSTSMTFTDDPIGSKFEGQEATTAIGSVTVSI